MYTSRFTLPLATSSAVAILPSFIIRTSIEYCAPICQTSPARESTCQSSNRRPSWAANGRQRLGQKVVPQPTRFHMLSPALQGFCMPLLAIHTGRGSETPVCLQHTVQRVAAFGCCPTPALLLVRSLSCRSWPARRGFHRVAWLAAGIQAEMHGASRPGTWPRTPKQWTLTSRRIESKIDAGHQAAVKPCRFRPSAASAVRKHPRANGQKMGITPDRGNAQRWMLAPTKCYSGPSSAVLPRLRLAPLGTTGRLPWVSVSSRRHSVQAAKTR
ncbi:hypothetical protein V8C26DRAFT_281298 [Trichoderma gracile]